MGDWAKRPKEITAVIDKLTKIKPELVGKIPTPTKKIDLDDLEEDTGDFGEFVQNGQEPTDEIENGIPLYHPVAMDIIQDRIYNGGGGGDQQTEREWEGR